MKVIVFHVFKVEVLGEVKCVYCSGEGLVRSVTEVQYLACVEFKREKT